ncbi:hypothetical protein [Nitrobacter vulgaris]|uniref:Uncharacterized protein n=1 Tax=Nitrobacter vulgaris TaxID=29421 RepID=A0A1V4I2S8_NITVU|nr:hypothetical protein [Nitrobacter vulgaris]OPH84526.1 hypothetical protein B2M20_00735 [Nitrobacter vulgaris]
MSILLALLVNPAAVSDAVGLLAEYRHVPLQISLRALGVEVGERAVEPDDEVLKPLDVRVGDAACSRFSSEKARR